MDLPSSNPADIARGAFRLLMERRLAPTPENYRMMYHEIVASPAEAPSLEEELQQLIKEIPLQTAAGRQLAIDLQCAILDKNWSHYRNTLETFIRASSEYDRQNWPDLFLKLIEALETYHTHWTLSQKKDSLQRILMRHSTKNTLAFEKLEKLISAWDKLPSEASSALIDGDEDFLSDENRVSNPAHADHDTAQLRFYTLRSVFSQSLQFIIGKPVEAEDDDITQNVLAISQKIEEASDEKSFFEILEAIKLLSMRITLVLEDRKNIRLAQNRLLGLLIDNVRELVVDEAWLSGQLAMLRELLNAPLSLQTIQETETRLKTLLDHQQELRANLSDARRALKELIAEFILRLSDFTDSTSEYHTKIGQCAEKVSEANSISELGNVLSEIMESTRTIQTSTVRSHEELLASKKRAEDAEQHIQTLEAALSRASNMARHDQLTGLLNRHGLNEVFEREADRAKRHQLSLCLAVLDLDNFKKLNDALGHAGGDAALEHLSRVVRETLRPQDTLARIGGEEFLILLNDTTLENAERILARLQRELTRQIFLYDTRHVLITFSAGVTEFQDGDSYDTAAERADQAMYRAKKAGKNRVFSTRTTATTEGELPSA